MIMPILDVRNVDQSIAFYRDQLEFSLQMVMPGPDGNNMFAILEKGTSQLALGWTQEQLQPRGVTLMIYVPDDVDLDEYYASVKSKGVVLDSEIKTEYWGDRVFSLKDPDGYALTLCKTVEETDMEKVAAIMRGEMPAE
jgi:uncharacterized glyoxalase superfamily protein PhnB